MVSKEHEQLKLRAKQLLLDKGFKDEEIFFEVETLVKNCRIDVIGKSENRVIAIECGDVSYYKIEKIKKIVSEVICIPHDKSFKDKYTKNHRIIKIRKPRKSKVVIYIDNKTYDKIKLLMKKDELIKNIIIHLKRIVSDNKRSVIIHKFFLNEQGKPEIGDKKSVSDIKNNIDEKNINMVQK